jgi:uncharacterized damage-inducible protein DinB
MTTGMLEHFRKLFAYDDWANRETLASIKAIEDPPPRSVKWLAHVVAAERLWLARILGEKQPMAVWPDLTVEQCQAELDRLRLLWQEFLGALDPAHLDRAITYTNSKGEAWTSKVEDILTHVISHSAYHRGQVASDVRTSGHTPAYTDYIHCVRQGLAE